MLVNESRHINLDSEHLRTHSTTRKLYQQLLAYPQEIIPIMDMVANNCFADRHRNVDLADRSIQVRPFNLDKKTNMRELNPSGKTLNKPVAFSAYHEKKKTLYLLQTLTASSHSRALSSVRATSSPTSSWVHVKMVDYYTYRATRIAAFFQCSKCGYTVEKEVDRGRIDEPNRCENTECQAVKSLNVIFNRCKYADKQIVRLQETPGKQASKGAICLLTQYQKKKIKKKNRLDP